MKLKSKKVYRAGLYSNGTPLPTVEYKGSPTVLVSLATYEPKLNEMTDITDELKDGMNLLQGQIRWIAVVYHNANDSVSECGVVTGINTNRE